ncbi:MAG: hypothetical protein DPW12_09680 [Rhodocyclaceae bacterium]|nr:hypothetical protein [Zoogloeaceae bacterium]MCG3168425.1 hypothetical protein [Bacteroidia bacterium]MCQ3924453.1 hypothetical protein [Rhodocyclaceae bacterium]HNT61484.1 hypothetical protein [Candidatus Desulfobacillus denitrificans]
MAITMGLGILVHADFGPTDDHDILNSIFQGRLLPLFVFPEMGRFCPMCFQELNLISVFTDSPVGYFLFQAASLAVFIFSFSWLLRTVSINYWHWLAPLSLILLAPGFVTIWLRIELCERNLVVLLALFLQSFLMFEKGRRYMLLPALLAAILAMYYKEPVFLLVGVFSTTYWLLQLKNGHRSWNWLSFLLIVSALIYIFIYYHFAFSQRAYLYGQQEFSTELLAVLAKTIGNFVLNDPLIVFIALPLTGWRIYRVFRGRSAAEPLFDAMLIAATAYAVLFLLLNIFSVYYWTPVYIFAVPAAIYFFGRDVEFVGIYWKVAAYSVALLYLISVLPTGIHLISYYKYVPINYNATVNFIANDIKQKRYATAPAIYIQGMAPDSASIYYDNLNVFLQARAGLKADQFVMHSEAQPATRRHMQVDGSAMKLGDPGYQAFYSVTRFPETIAPKTGDYLVVIPQTTKNVDRTYLEQLQESCCERVFSTSSPLAVPNYSLKTLLKLAAKRAGIGKAMGENYYGMPDYYVFVRR